MGDPSFGDTLSMRRETGLYRVREGIYPLVAHLAPGRNKTPRPHKIRDGQQALAPAMLGHRERRA